MARKRPLTVSSFLSLENELSELRRNYPFDAKAEEAAEAGIRDICNKSFGDQLDPFSRKSFGERLVILLSRRWRSSADFVEYGEVRNLLLTRLAEVSAQKQKQGPEEYRQRRSDRMAARDTQMALEFQSQRGKSKFISESHLMAEIGKRRHKLGRSASIAAIKRGLKSLKK